MYQSARKLAAIAESQQGFFTAKQAQAAGFSRCLQAYNCRVGKWNKFAKGLFRLADYSHSLDADFVRWTLWSRNNHDQPQGVISHASALALHGLGPAERENVHLTVPPAFRKQPPAGCIIHKEALNLSAIESRPGFMVTRLAKTLADSKPALCAQGQWDKTLTLVWNEGRLLPEEALQLGFSPPERMPEAGSSPVTDFAFDGPAETPGDSGGSGRSHYPPAGALAGSDPGRSESAVTGVGPVNRHSVAMTEKVYEMIFRHTRPHPATARRAQGGFTLVELLVVTAIVSLLAGMLLPALEQSLEQARYVACASNQKQLGLAFGLYAADYDGLAMLRWSSSAPYGAYGLSFYARFAGTPPVLQNTSYLTPDTLVCPSIAPRRFDLGNSGEAIKHTYAVNNMAPDYKPIMTLYNSSDASGYICVPLDQLPQAEKKAGHRIPLVLEARQADNPSQSALVTRVSLINFANLMHSRRVNVLSADGHVDAATSERLRTEFAFTKGYVGNAFYDPW